MCKSKKPTAVKFWSGWYPGSSSVRSSSPRVLIDYAATIRKAINNTWRRSHACTANISGHMGKHKMTTRSLCPGVDNLNVLAANKPKG